MAVDMFLKIDGIPGESTDSKHKDWIEVLSYSFGASQPSAGAAWGSSWTGWKEALLGGFQLQGIFQYQAGRPLTLGNNYYNGNLSDLYPVITSGTIGVLGGNNITDNVFQTNIQNTGFYFTDDASARTASWTTPSSGTTRGSTWARISAPCRRECPTCATKA